VPVNERCCDKFGNCELERVAEYIGIEEDVPRYSFRELPVEDAPLFIRDHNLCISCGRCVRVCRDVRGMEALGIVYNGDEYIVGTLGSSLEESECRFCSACVAVCPTGALMDKDLRWPASEEDLLPCKHTCPAGVDVPRYIRLINEQKFADAVAVIREKVPFPSVLGYVCHHPCEEECRRGEVNEAMSICALKRFAAERDTGLWKIGLKEAPSTGKRIAVVGSGPAGLTAAYYLARKGHAVTVFELQSELGGMMRFGAPEYRLPRDVLEKDIADILALGVDVKTGIQIGENLSLEDLENQYDAIFLATGAPLSKRLKIAGVELEGVLWGVDFLRDVNSGRDVKVRERVFVIGGGNVAIDAARAALRSGAREVLLACLESKEEMPAHEWQIAEAVEEGVIIGQDSDLSFLDGRSGIQATRGVIEVDEDALQTGVPKIFAGGDVVSGAASVIEAIAMGRKAAVSIDRFLGGDGVIDETLIEHEKLDPWLGKEEGFAKKQRVQIPYLPLEERLQDFSLVEFSFDEEMALEEAKRCLRCDLRLAISPVVLPPEKWLEFSSDNVSVVPETSGVYQLLDEKKMIIYIVGTPNLRRDLEQQLQTVKKARHFGYEEEPMYTKRESELIQKFLKEHGKMPELNEELLDLF